MSNVKISNLPPVTTLLNSDVIPVVASSVTSKITLQNLANSIPQVTSSISASYSVSSSFVTSASFATSASFVTSASFATSASFVTSASFATSASFVTNAISSSYPIAVTGSSMYSNGLGSQAPIYKVPGGYFQDGQVIPYTLYLGYDAGRAANSSYATFIGYRAGISASFSDDSVFIGEQAGEEASNAAASNFIGIAGYQASFAGYSNFIGYLAGSRAYTSSYSNFLGYQAGYNTVKAQYSNFIGINAGYLANSSSYSNFIGADAGYYANSSSYSNLIGYRAGYNVLGGSSGIGTNNIIIGTNITLGTGRKDSINLGGLIFATGSYSTTTGNPFSGSVNGRVGINQPIPTQALDVSGSVQISQVLVLPPQNPLPSGIPTGSIASSGSGVDCKPYFWNGSTWTALF